MHTTGNILLHIPHASTLIPTDVRKGFLLTEPDLQQELLRMTDAYTDDLFDLVGATKRVIFPVSRLVVDPERFADDAQEVMAARGMGVVYTRTQDGRPLRGSVDRADLLKRYYEPHHRELDRWVALALEAYGTCLLVDCHSFPSAPLPCDLDQTPSRPDICIGTDAFHTLPELRDAASAAFAELGYGVEIDRPYSGSLVPAAYYGRDTRVCTVMVEINRRLYMDENTGEKLPEYMACRESIRAALNTLITFWNTTQGR